MSALSSAESPGSPLSHGSIGAEWTATHEAFKANNQLCRSLDFDGVQQGTRRASTLPVLWQHAQPRHLFRASARGLPDQAAFHALSEKAIVDAGKASPK